MSSHKVFASSDNDNHTYPRLSPCLQFTPIKLMTSHESILFTFGLPVKRRKVSSIMFTSVHA